MHWEKVQLLALTWIRKNSFARRRRRDDDDEKSISSFLHTGAGVESLAKSPKFGDFFLNVKIVLGNFWIVLE
jgi:hypothetical protein